MIDGILVFSGKGGGGAGGPTDGAKAGMALIFLSSISSAGRRLQPHLTCQIHPEGVVCSKGGNFGLLELVLGKLDVIINRIDEVVCDTKKTAAAAVAVRGSSK